MISHVVSIVRADAVTGAFVRSRSEVKWAKAKMAPKKKNVEICREKDHFGRVAPIASLGPRPERADTRSELSRGLGDAHRKTSDTI